MSKLFMVAVGLMAASTAVGQIFECVDAKGNKEFAQFCAPDAIRQTPVQQGGKSGSAGSESPAASSIAEQEIASRKRALEKQEADARAEKEKAQADVNQRNCELARNQLKLLQGGQRMTRTDPTTGERIFIDDKSRPAEIVDAQESVDMWCKR